MSNPVSTTERAFRPFKRAISDRGGTAAISFAIVFPVLLTITVGITEVAMIALDYHRVGEAARRAARTASMLTPIADMTLVENGNAVICAYDGDGLGCGAAGIQDATTFAKIVDEVRSILPKANSSNVTIRYEPSGLGDPNTPAGILPILHVRISGIEHEFLVFGTVIGLEGGLTLPAIDATTVSSSVDSSNI